MKTKLLGLILVIAMLSMLIIPATYAWNYGNPAIPADNKEEWFGPRANKILIPLYATETAEWADLQVGKIDVTDWPLDDSHYTAFTTPPLNNSIEVVAYGPEFGMREFDLNVNNNTYLGNPPNPAYPNPQIRMSGSVAYGEPLAELALRQAVAYLTDRNSYVTHCGSVTNIAVYTLVGANSLHTSPWGKYTDWTITPGGGTPYTWAVTYNPTAANATLDASGQFPWVGGVREYQPMPSDVPIPFTLVEYSRTDDPCRSYAGDQIAAALRSVGIQVNEIGTDIAGAHTHVMGNKEFDIYTGGWSLDVVPDYLILWDWAFYWHPGRPYNYGGINDPISNAAAEAAYAANTQADAVAASIAFQEEIAKMAWVIPLWIAAGNKAVSRTYTGGNNGVPIGDAEDIYRGLYWTGFINEAGFGTDNYFSFLDMHPTGYDFGNGAMTIRYGFKTATLQELNPVYTEFLWDQNVIGLVGYDSLVTRDPLNLATFAPWAASAYTVGTYNNPALGTCTKVIYTLRSDYAWQDGVPVTIADFYFTFITLPQTLAARGLAAPWWISSVLDVLSFSVLDSNSFEILYDAKAVFAIGWAGGAEVLPEHIWKPIVTNLDPTVTMPDPNLVGSGAWRLAEYVANSHVLLVANTPGSVNFCQAVPTGNQVGCYAASPVTSPQGYFRLLPVSVDLELDPPVPLAANSTAYLATLPYGGYWAGIRKLPPITYPMNYTFDWNVTNWWADRALSVEIVSVHSNMSIGGPWDSRSTGDLTGFLSTTSVSIPPGTGGIYGIGSYPNTVTILNFDGAVQVTITQSHFVVNSTGDLWFYANLNIFVWGPAVLTDEGGTHIATPLPLGEYHVCIALEFDGFKLPIPPFQPNVPFHEYTDWWLGTLWADIGGQNLIQATLNGIAVANPNFGWPVTETVATPANWPIPASEIPPYPSSAVTMVNITLPGIGVSYTPWYTAYASEQTVADGKVDGRDITIAAKAFGTKPGDTRWNTVADVNHDYKIDGRDITIIAKNFGWPPALRPYYWIH